MTDKEPLDKLEKRWGAGKMTVNEMIDHLFVHLKDHQKAFARHEVRMLNTERRFRSLIEQIEAFEQWMAKARKQVAALWDRLKGQGQE